MKPAGLGALVAACLIIFAVIAERRTSYPGVAPMKLAAAEFVVTSSGDAGPGTLRDAILAADRVADRAHIIVRAKQIALESALPALINPHGIIIDTEPGAGIIDAARQPRGATLKVSSPGSAVKGLTIVNAHESAVLVTAANVLMDTVVVTDSRIGIVLAAAANGFIVRTSLFERNETGITAESSIQEVAILSSIFRANTRAGFWFVGGEEFGGGAPAKERVRIFDGVFEKNTSGIVLANGSTFIQKSRFLNNAQSAILILSGAARMEDNEIRGSGGTAISVTSGKGVLISRNALIGNQVTAIMVRDSEVTIEHNTLQTNAFGIVSILSHDFAATLIRDNLIERNSADAITVIGGSPKLQRNQVIDNRSAGMRILDLELARGALKATPVLEANVLKGNGIDLPPPGSYKLASTLTP